MKTIFTLLSIIFMTYSSAQQLPNFPIEAGAGTAQVWNEQIFYFGGSINWGGSWQYPRVYKFDGTSWSYYDSIPDNNMWDVRSALVNDYVYLLGGWPGGPGFTRRYHIPTKQWTYLSNSPNTQTWGITSEYINGKIYLINSSGKIWEYTIATDSWSEKTSLAASGSWDLSSILYNNEIYVLGYSDSSFYKYSPATDSWTQLQNAIYQVGATAMGIINNYIYCAGGNNNGGSGATYETVIRYDILTNSWTQDNITLSEKRHWMARAVYKGGLYVIGGFDASGNAVNNVEEIIPQGTGTNIKELSNETIPDNFTLSQNFPNPFNPSTTISFSLPLMSNVLLKVFDILGAEITTLVNEMKEPGDYEVIFDADKFGLSSGIYFYQLFAESFGQKGNFTETKKLILMK